MNSLLQKQLTYTPIPQTHFTFRNAVWEPSMSTMTAAPSKSSSHMTSLRLITWNIDFMAPYPTERMASALVYLEGLISSIPTTTATVIFLQEMQEAPNPRQLDQSATDLSQLRDASWVQQKFHITDLTPVNWDLSSYGTVTLVDKRLMIAGVSRLHFMSEYQRDALLVDIAISASRKILRLCNVHLDSMNGSMRPIQWKAAAHQLQNSEGDIYASILAGDCNANQPRDRTEPQENGFKDVYLELGGVEGDEHGMTWGFQCHAGAKWGRQRLDKVVCWGDIEPKSLERIGVGVKATADELVKKDLEHLEGMNFVTDHYGLMADFEIPAGLSC
ncbi:hypothetical protein EJ04DRAFT_443408 [Polyplosphaeria fusca]|uniref:Endonuclease/exonuclease/phosphatase domain-containing protein n=1 Tax=Polyplosphaeria fusca TaxID=682080 RepID=A0A9P4QPG2_9PLEO|nr:hypothetical protein EJ04DRAFT_443408 [Polyplosphaeria fusca]